MFFEKQSMNKVSIITVVYNMVDEIEATILSVINQTYSNLEYIIIDGGSVDGTVEIIKKYNEKITFWISEPDGGIYDAMNKGVSKSTGTYCNFMNAGDCFYNNTVLEKIFSRERTEDVLHGATITDKGRVTLPIAAQDLSLFFFYRTSLGHQASFIRTELLRKHPYDTKYPVVADIKFFIETLILNNYSYIALPEKVCIYDTTGISSNEANTKKELRSIFDELFPERIIKDYERMNDMYNPLVRIIYPLSKTSLFQVVIFPFLKKISRVKDIRIK